MLLGSFILMLLTLNVVAIEVVVGGIALVVVNLVNVTVVEVLVVASTYCLLVN